MRLEGTTMYSVVAPIPHRRGIHVAAVNVDNRYPSPYRLEKQKNKKKYIYIYILIQFQHVCIYYYYYIVPYTFIYIIFK